MTTADEQAKKKGLPTWAKIAIAVVVIAIVLFGLHELPIQEKLEAFKSYVQELGPKGRVLFVLVYSVVALLFPASVLTLGAGGIFGPWLGTALVSVGSTMCACLAFVIGRYGARAWVQKKMAGFPKFAVVERAVSQQGFKIVFLTRLSPAFPFTWMNYMYGVTTVPFWKYALASWIGMLPGTFLYVYLGYAASQGAAAAGGGSGFTWVSLVKYASFIIPTLIVTVIVGRIAKKELAKATATPAA